jgi:hypothetical protein
MCLFRISRNTNVNYLEIQIIHCKEVIDKTYQISAFSGLLILFNVFATSYFFFIYI